MDSPEAAYFVSGGTLINAGAILGADSAAHGTGVSFGSGGLVSNLSGGTIAGFDGIDGATSVVNAGQILGGSDTSGQVVILAAGGSLTNQSGGTISGGFQAVAAASGGAIAITNQASAVITSTNDAIALGSAGGTVTNAGTIVGGTAAFAEGVYFLAGGTVVNQAGGTIGAQNAVTFAGAGLVANAGTIAGNAVGIYMHGGTIINQASGAISGTIDAAKLASGHTNRVIVYPSASFVGTVDGGNTIGAGSISTLELASSAGVGTLAGLGTQYIDFAQVTVDSGAAWTLAGAIGGFATLTNAGTLENNVTLGGNGLTLSNLSGGTITGFSGVLGLGAAELVGNAGYIYGNSQGVSLGAGGLVANASGGTIAGFSGVLASGAAATVSNAGSIHASIGYGVSLGAGGLVTNASGGTILGNTGVLIAGAAGTVLNAGYIGYQFTGVKLEAGGTVTNVSGGTIVGGYGVWATNIAAAVVNAGTIAGTYAQSYGVGAYLSAGGSVTNQSGGLISGYRGVVAKYGAMTVVNAGSIDGYTASSGGAGVDLMAGGSVTNQSGGTITGYSGVLVSGAAATVSNATFIDGTGGTGVYLQDGGSISNASGATIAGSAGVYIEGGAGTVQNAGYIQGTTSAGVQLTAGGTVGNQSGGTIAGTTDAVSFAGGYTNRLVFYPGATFAGTVDGGNIIGTGSISTLELASAATAGTLSELGTKYIDFAQVTIDSNANWVFAGTNSIAALASLTNSGTLTDTGTLFNDGTITGNRLQLSDAVFTNQANGLISGSYVYGVRAGGTDTVTNLGTITATSGYAVYLAATGGATGIVNNGTGGLIVGQAGVKIYGTGGSVTNLGTIAGTYAFPSNYGVYLRNGGSVANGQSGAGTSTASIQGYYAGVVFKSARISSNYSGSLTNYGTIVGTATLGTGALLDNGGTVLNGQSGATGALIEGGRWGISDAGGAITNDATVIATGSQSGDYGIYISGTGVVSNLGTASLIEGYAGIKIGTDGTVTNAGTIASNQGTSGTAIDFTDGNARLIDDPGAVFIGSIYGGAGGTATFELASASNAGTVVGFGTSITNFTTLLFDSGSQWTVEGDDSANGLGTLAIQGFTIGDTIDLSGFLGAQSDTTFSSSGSLLTVGDGFGDYETLHIAGTFVTNNFHVVSDGHGGTDIYIAPIPTITAGATANFNGGGGPVVLDGSIDITDANGTLLSGATIEINSGFAAGDVLAFNNGSTAEVFGDGSTIIASYDPANGVLALSGPSSIQNYESALDSVTYSVTPSDADPTGGGGDTGRSIEWIVNDATGTSVPSFSTLDVMHIAPSITASGTVGFSIGGTAVALDGSITVSDPDSGDMLTGASVWINNGSIAGDVLNYTSLTGLGISGTYNSLTGALSLTGDASIAAYDSALASITYSSTASDPSYDATKPTRTIDWTVTDGSSSNGTSNTGVTTLDVYGPPPVLSGATGQTATFIQQGSAVVADDTITVTDGDSTTLAGATVTINSSEYLAGDTLVANVGTTGIVAAFSDGTLTLSGVASLGDYEQVLDSVTYSSTATDPTNGVADFDRTLTWQVNDGRGGNSLSNIGTTVVQTHVRPVVTTGSAAVFGINGGAILVQPTLGVTDNDTNLITSATVAITSGSLSTDVLAFNSGTDTENFIDGATISASYNNGTLTFAESGSLASTANWQQALDSVTYDNTGTNPNNGGTDDSRTLTWTLNTGLVNPSQTSVPVTSTVDLAPPPVITGTQAGQTTTDEAAIDPFSGVTITDPSTGQTETVTVTLSDNTDGTLSDTVGGTVTNGDTYVVTGSTLAVTTALDALVFTPTAHQVVPGGTVTTGFTIAATNSDGATDSNTTTTVIATAVNDPPTISTTAINAGVPNQTASQPFADLAISDPDVGGHVGTLTVSLSSADGGSLSVLSGGTFDAATGVYTLVGTISALSTALEDLVFTPGAPSNGSYVSTTGLSIEVTDSGGDAIDNAVTVTTVTQVLGLTGSGNDSIAVSPNGTNFPAASPGATNEAIISSPSIGGSYAVPSGYQAAFLGGTASAALNAGSVSGALLVGNSGNDTITAGGNDDTLTGGAGNNNFSAGGNGDVVGVSGLSTVSTSGHDDTVYADDSTLTLTDSGSGDAIGLSGAQANVTLSGSGAVVYANSGTLNLVDDGSGDAIGGYTGTIAATLGGSGSRVYGGSGPLSVDVASTASGVAIGTGSGTAAVTIAGSTTTIYGGAGPLSVDAVGNDAVIGTDGTSTLTVSGSNATVYGGAGSLTGYVSGSNAVIGLDGPAALTLAGSGAEVFGGSNTATILDLGSADTIGAGPGPMTIEARGSNLVVAGGGGNLQFVGGGGNATVYAGTGSTTVTGGSGATTLYGGAGGTLTYLGGTGSVVYQAGPGAETLNGAAATAPLQLIGGADPGGHDVLIGGSGNDTLFANTSTDTLTGGAGNNAFVFYKTVIAGAAPNDVITDFNGNDLVYLAGYGGAEASHDIGAAVSSGGNTTLTLSDNTRITFLGVGNASALTGHVVSF